MNSASERESKKASEGTNTVKVPLLNTSSRPLEVRRKTKFRYRPAMSVSLRERVGPDEVKTAVVTVVTTAVVAMVVILLAETDVGAAVVAARSAGKSKMRAGTNSILA